MERIQIQLDRSQIDELRRYAGARDVSISSVVRDAVAAYLTDAPREDRVARALAAGGAYRSGRGDVSDDHDRYLADDLR